MHRVAIQTVDVHLNRSKWRQKERKHRAQKNVKVSGTMYKFTRIESFLSKETASRLNQKRINKHKNKPMKKEKEVTTEDTMAHQLYLVIRLGTSYGISEAIRHGLNSLGVTKVGSAVFLQATETNKQILNRLKDHVMWGCPDSTQVQLLLQKRGYAQINHKLIPLSDNKFIEEQLGSIGIVCMEDITHELTTVGTHFKRVKKWLAPFKLTAPKGGWKIQLGNGGKASHLKEDQYGAPIEPEVAHNGYKTPEEMQKILKPII